MEVANIGRNGLTNQNIRGGGGRGVVVIAMQEL